MMFQHETLVIDDALINDLSQRLNIEVRVSPDTARVEISAVIMDSRSITEGCLFACVVGEN
ncbi:MAG TPA: hypothetical protein DEB38_01715, partial [Acidimicrobiaceae bacterium]|nr:hypothetical protein [Acidimicrobiaceae bacterium]